MDWQERLKAKGIDLTEDFKIETLLTSDVEVASWSGHGLPTDELCVQNGILVTRSARWPLCVDPQMQIVTWLKKKEEKAGNSRFFHVFSCFFLVFSSIFWFFGSISAMRWPFLSL